jgi:hypothetical protein
VSDVLVNNGFRVSVAENGTAMTQTLATTRVSHHPRCPDAR